MREEVRYYAYDDTEFFDREECEAYEERVRNILISIIKKCSFFDKDMNIFLPPTGSSNINDWMNFLENAFNNSPIIHREENFTDEENTFLHYEFGYCFNNEEFNNETGWFRWDKGEIEWVKMDE